MRPTDWSKVYAAKKEVAQPANLTAIWGLCTGTLAQLIVLDEAKAAIHIHDLLPPIENARIDRNHPRTENKLHFREVLPIP